MESYFNAFKFSPDLFTDVDAIGPPVAAGALYAASSVLPPEHWYTDGASCVLDAINIACGRLLLRREDLETSNCDDGILLRDNGVRRALREVSCFARLVYRSSLDPNINGKPPRFRDVLAEPAGLFLIEFNWRRGELHDNHMVVANCYRRLVMCNTIGVVPFMFDMRRETSASHAKVRRHFHVRNVIAVYRLECF